MNRMWTLVLGGSVAYLLAGCASAGSCAAPDVEAARVAAAAAMAQFFLEMALFFAHVFAHCH